MAAFDRQWRAGLQWLAVAACLLAIPATPVGADDRDANDRQNTPPPRLHLFSGTDAASRSAFAHGGLIVAPRGHLHESGWRLRAVAEAGLYRYDAGDREIRGRLSSVEFLPGFQWLRSSYGVSVFAGGMTERQTTRPFDPNKPRQGTRGGGRVFSEGWWRVGPRVILNASGGYATATRNYDMRFAITFETSERLMLEPEIAVFGEPGYRQTRVGAFVGWSPHPARRIMVGGGWSFDPDGSAPYAGFQLKAWR